MKLFTAYGIVELTHEPAWLPAFRAAYDRPFPYHITLKQPCFVAESQIADIKQALATVMQGEHTPGRAISLVFDRLKVDEPDGSIMLGCTEAVPSLVELQKEIVARLEAYQRYYEAGAGQWERDFQPHLTIARGLTTERLDEALHTVPQNTSLEGTMRSLTLVVAGGDKPDLSATKLPEDLTQYPFY